MLRTLIVIFILILPVWAPWMDKNPTTILAESVLEAFGPVPSACYDSNGIVLHEGIEVRWYPMGRLIHTCSGDYIVWFWGSVKEAGGVYKRPDEIQPVRSRPLTCTEVLERQEARRSTSTDSTITYYTGTPAAKPDYSIFPEAQEYGTVITAALAKGANFAGKFAVAEWQCGFNCQNHVVLDVSTGRIISVGPQTEYGISYTRESTLLVTNPLNALPPIPESSYETEGVALGIARLPREYYRLTTDALSGTEYLVRECIESSATGYIEIEDDRLDVIEQTRPE